MIYDENSLWNKLNHIDSGINRSQVKLTPIINGLKFWVQGDNSYLI